MTKQKLNHYLLEKAFEIATLEKEYKTMKELEIKVMVVYHRLNKYGCYKMKNGLTYHKDGTATKNS